MCVVFLLFNTRAHDLWPGKYGLFTDYNISCICVWKTLAACTWTRHDFCSSFLSIITLHTPIAANLDPWSSIRDPWSSLDIVDKLWSCFAATDSTINRRGFQQDKDEPFNSRLNEKYTLSQRETVICIPCSRIREAKTIPCWAAHPRIANIWEYPPPRPHPPPSAPLGGNNNTFINTYANAKLAAKHWQSIHTKKICTIFEHEEG